MTPSRMGQPGESGEEGVGGGGRGGRGGKGGDAAEIGQRFLEHVRSWALVAAFVVYGIMLGYSVHHIDQVQNSVARNAHAARLAAEAGAAAARQTAANGRVILRNQAKLDQLIKGEYALCLQIRHEEALETHTAPVPACGILRPTAP